MSASRHNFLVAQKQERQWAHERLVASNREQSTLNEKLRWEQKREKVNENIVTQQKVNEIKSLKEDLLLERQHKVAALLTYEQALYRAELENLIETPYERRQKLIDRAKTVKKKNQEKNISFALDQQSKQWRNSIDELRTEDVKVRELLTALARDAQLAEKVEAKEDEERIKKYFDQLILEGHDKLLAAEKARQQADAERNHQFKGELDTLMEQKEADYLQSVEMKREQDRRRETARLEEEAFQKSEQERKMTENRFERQDIQRQNEAERLKRLDLERFQMEEDAALMNQAIKRDQALCEAEEDHRAQMLAAQEDFRMAQQGEHARYRQLETELKEAKATEAKQKQDREDEKSDQRVAETKQKQRVVQDHILAQMQHAQNAKARENREKEL
eukprot:Platyproteum_vivax@DN5365_c0_g1_i1.p1